MKIKSAKNKFRHNVCIYIYPDVSTSIQRNTLFLKMIFYKFHVDHGFDLDIG